jgi:hypothetical protein
MAAPEFPWSKHGTRTSRKLAERNVDDVPMDFGFLNTAFAQPSEGYARFRLFPRLPLELRRRIWKFSLPTQRLLKITLTAAGSTGDPASPFENNVMDSPVHATYQNENHLGNIVSGAGYYVRLDSTKTVSPLLYVSHEASAVVRRIFRVQVPTVQCIGHTSSPFLQFCPKRDTILVAIERKEDEAYFADFVHDAQAYDHKRKGVLHLAIMDKGSSLHLPMG